ncbi:MAG: AAA family ATPase [Phycisphaerales bacterium]
MPNNKNKSSTRPIHAPTPICTNAKPTARSLNALLPFGLLPTHQPTTRETQPLAPELLNQLLASKHTLITGPSGSGKSTLLTQLKETLQYKHQTVINQSDLPIESPTLPIINLFESPLNQTLSLLSAVGLAEPKLWTQPATTLSTGEHARLQIARLIDRALQSDLPTTILIDELATPLDRLTARSLGASLIKAFNRFPSIKLIAAAAHEDLPTYLDTDLLIRAANRAILPNQYTPEPITYEPGTIEDYRALKPHHYIASDPASIAQITRATRTCPITNTTHLAAVLVVAYPTLNASWRDRAWPGRYTSSTKSQNAKRINAELRCLARIITASNARGLSIASTLVRNYLSNPLTPVTEALAAMGSTNPFLKIAGMTEYPVPHSPTDLRLLDTLHHLNQTPHNLLFPPLPLGEGRGEGLSSSQLHPLLTRELQTWARARNLNPHAENLAHHAAFRLLTQPRAYTHVNNNGGQQS